MSVSAISFVSDGPFVSARTSHRLLATIIQSLMCNLVPENVRCSVTLCLMSVSALSFVSDGPFVSARTSHRLLATSIQSLMCNLVPENVIVCFFFASCQ